MEIEIKKKARFMFLPRFIEIAREDREEMAYKVAGGQYTLEDQG